MVSPETRPQLETIGDLKSRRFIKGGSPLWWSTDYLPDPREHLTFEEFKERLVCLGQCPTKIWGSRGEDRIINREVYLYPEPNVPMAVLNLPVSGQDLPFLVTARPYHPKEADFEPWPVFLVTHPLEKLPEFIQNGGVIDLPEHFYPHIRGLFAGRRGNNFFWYPLRVFSYWHEFGVQLRTALEKQRLSFVYLYDPPFSENRRYTEVWQDLLRRGLVDQRKPAWFDFAAEEVSCEEFLRDWLVTAKDLFFYYPLRVLDLTYPLPLIVATRSHKESKIRKPVVLGIYAENELHGYGHRWGILRIKDRLLATEISRLISAELGLSIEAVLFTPQPGRPKYERVLGTNKF